LFSAEQEMPPHLELVPLGQKEIDRVNNANPRLHYQQEALRATSHRLAVEEVEEVEEAVE
jgi:hypothetical protein